MRKWVLAMLHRGPEYDSAKGEARKRVFQGHFDNMSRLASLGRLRLAGPFEVPKDAAKNAAAGLFLLDVQTLDEARELCESDPTVKARVFDVELLIWWGPSDITYRGDTSSPSGK